MTQFKNSDVLLWCCVLFVLTVASTLLIDPWNIQRRLFPKPGRKELELAGTQIVRQLVSYKEEYGEFPVTLERANIDPIQADHGPFKYEVKKGGKSFRLAIGDILSDGFSLIYHPESGWYFDS